MTPEEYLQKLEASMTENQSEVVVEETPVTTEQAPKKKKKRKKKNYLLRFVIFVVLVVGIIFLMRSSLFYVKNIEVVGNQFYTPAQVIEMSGLATGKNMFFETKTRPARYALLETPYIKLANIRRVLPATLRIELTERVEYATIPNEEGEFILIDNEGMVLSRTDKQPPLTVLEGMNIEELTEGSPLKIEQTYLLTDTLELLDKMEEADLYFYKIYFSSVVVKAYINENYYCEGQPSEISANIEALKALMQEQYNAGVNKGIIRVGSNGYMAFDPKID